MEAEITQAQRDEYVRYALIHVSQHGQGKDADAIRESAMHLIDEAYKANARYRVSRPNEGDAVEIVDGPEQNRGRIGTVDEYTSTGLVSVNTINGQVIVKVKWLERL